MQSDTLPFVETTVARVMLSRMKITHEECGISVISGPWGIGKTTAIDAFTRDHEYQCAVIKVEQSGAKRGATGGGIMRQVVEALRKLNGKVLGTQLSNATWTLRQQIYTEMAVLHDFGPALFPRGGGPAFTFIFDEAQFLSREAIEMLRYWNDRDRTTTPYPVGLIFVGNNEFAMAETLGGESVLSGAVRSRLLYELPLAYTHLSDTDLTLFAQSRGVSDAPALRDFVAYFSNPRVKRDLRTADRLLAICRREAGDGPITHAILGRLLHDG